MKAWIGAVAAGVLGLAVGLVAGGGAGGLIGSGVGALTGAHLGVCKAGLVAVEKGVIDEATADRIVSETLAELRRTSPEVVKSTATNLATCRTEKGMDLFAG